VYSISFELRPAPVISGILAVAVVAIVQIKKSFYPFNLANNSYDP
jgi:hypothetical protein